MRFERWLGALHERNFRLYFIGQLTSEIGTGMTPVALSFAVLALAHGSAVDVGAVLSAQTVPIVALLLVGGVAGDRFGRRRVMLAADVFRAIAQLLLAGWVLFGHPRLWSFLLLSALVGTGTAFFMPSLTGLIPEIASRGRLTQANAFRGLTFAIGGIVGPSVAGVIVAAASPGWAIAVDALSYVVSACSLAALRLGPVATSSSESFLVQLRQGWDEFWSRTWLWAMVLAASVANTVITAPYIILGAVIAKTTLGGASVWGWILGAQGVGAVVGGVGMLRIRFRRPLVAAMLSLLVWPFPLLTLAFSAPVPVIAVAAFLGGACFACVGANWETTLQREIPREVLSRISAYDAFGSLVLLPIGYAVVGPVASLVGVRAVFVAGSVSLVVAVAFTLLIPSVRQMSSKTTDT